MSKSSNTTEVGPSRRQAHKLRTERQLQQAALELFAGQGYDETTTEEIAERAGVSPRTFFRYFPTKESVLFVGEYGWLQTFTEALVAQPSELSDLEAMRATLVERAPDLSKRRRALLLYEQATSSSATLRGRVLDHLEDDVAHLAKAIATRRGLDHADEACGLVATVGLHTYRRGLRAWLALPASRKPGPVIERHFDLVAHELAPLGSHQPARR